MTKKSKPRLQAGNRKRRCKCPTEPYYTGMQPTARDYFLVAFRCTTCGEVWNQPASKEEALAIRTIAMPSNGANGSHAQ